MGYPRAAKSLTLLRTVSGSLNIWADNSFTDMAPGHGWSSKRPSDSANLSVALCSATPSNPPATCTTWHPAHGSLPSHSSTAKLRFHTSGPQKAPAVL